MKNQALTQLANRIVVLRAAASPPVPSTIPQPLIYKSGAHTGAMIALFLPTSTGVRFIQSDPKALPPSELHITLTSLGKAADLSTRQIMETHDLMKLVSENHPPLTGHINGCGRFCNGDDDGDPFFIIPDLPALPNLREIAISSLKSGGIEGAKDHGFVPHITLTYLPHAEYNPFDILEKTPITFSSISLVLADDRYDYPLTQGVSPLSYKALIEKIGARHAHHEIFQIQHIHDLTLELGAECHSLTRRAGARHSQGDQGMIQRMHDDCAGLGAVCKGLPEKDRVYGSQVLKEISAGGILSKKQVGSLRSGDGLPETIVTKAQSDAPNYKAAATPQRCANCRFFLGDPGRDWCDLFDFTADQDFVCDAWEAQRPDEIPGYVANKGDLAALTEGILILRGGRTSGNWGHVGRKGKRGGSGGGGGFGRIGIKPGASRKTVKQAAKKKQAKAKPKVQVKPKVAAKKPSVKPKVKPRAKAKPLAVKKPLTKPKATAKKPASTGSKKLDVIFNKAPKGNQQNFTNHLVDKMTKGEITMQEAQKLNALFSTAKEPAAKSSAPKKKPSPKKKPTGEDLKPGKGRKVSDGLNLNQVPKSGKSGTAVHDTVDIINSVHSDGRLDKIPVKLNDSKREQGTFINDPVFQKAKAINVNNKGTHPHMTAAHEIGHNLDYQAIGRSGEFSESSLAFGRKDAKVKAKVEEVYKAMDNSKAIRTLNDTRRGPKTVNVKKDGKTLEYKTDQKYTGYLLQKREMFARAYAQYITTKSGDKRMLKELDTLRTADKKAKISYPRQWDNNDFKAISKSFDSLFAEMEWIE